MKNVGRFWKLLETKIDDSFNDNLFQAEGYKMERQDRTAHGGGLMAHILADLPFKRRKDLESDEVESICYYQWKKENGKL